MSEGLHLSEVDRSSNADVKRFLLGRQHLFHNLRPAPAFIDVMRNLFHLDPSLSQVLLVPVCIGRLIDNRSKEEGVLEQALDGFDEKRRDVPCMGMM